MILLSDEEIAKAIFPILKPVQGANYEGFISDEEKTVAKAQARKILEWGNEICPHYTAKDMDSNMVVIECYTPYLKRECEKCWAALQKEIEEGAIESQRL